jgi:ankyrin repeat protein
MEPEAFTFIVCKTLATMEITIFSEGLYSELIGIPGLEDLQVGVGDQQRTVNGLVLLKHYHILKRTLSILHSKPHPNTTTRSLVSEMELLVDGLLADGEVFKSFGYEDLYEREFLDFEHWREFQQEKLERDISALEEGFYAIDDLEELPIPPVDQNSFNLRPTQAESSVDIVEHVIDAADDFGELPASIFHANPNNLQSTEVEPTSSEVYSFGELPSSAGRRFIWFGHEDTAQLVEAAKAGHEDGVRLLLNQGVPANSGYIRGNSAMAEAAKARPQEFVRLLLNRGVTVDSIRITTSSALTEAAKAGHEAVVRLLLDRGAPVDSYCWRGNSALVEAAKAGHEAVVRLLLDRGAFVDSRYTWESSALAEAVEAGHESIVRLLLDWGAVLKFKEFDQFWCPTLVESAKAWHLSDRFLVAAATCGHISAVRWLLKSGADVNAVTPHDSALSAAVRAGHDYTVHFLLQQGADVQTAAVILRGLGNSGSAVKRLFKIASRVRNGITGRSHHHNSEKVLKLQYLHRKFRDQHILMLKATQSSSTEFRELSQRFRYYQEAWAAGIRTMRGLCSGEQPGNVGDTIAFLCLARALSETLATSACDYNEQFLQDLGRWQVLFASKETDLDAYREAVQSMWDVALDEIVPRQRQDEALLHFQTLASSLISLASESLGFSAVDDTGLECSQQRWHLRNSQILSYTDLSDNISGLHFSGASGAQLSETIHPQLPNQVIRPNGSTLREQIQYDISSSSINMTVILLMAGAIFAIVLIFLQRAFLHAIQLLLIIG